MSEVVQSCKIFKVCVIRYAGGLILSHCSLEGKFKHPRSLSKSRRILTLKASSRSSSSPSQVRGGSRPTSLTWEVEANGVSRATAVWDRASGLWSLPSRQTCPCGRSPWGKGAATHPAHMGRGSPPHSRAWVMLGAMATETGDLPGSTSHTLQPLGESPGCWS